MCPYNDELNNNQLNCCSYIFHCIRKTSRIGKIRHKKGRFQIFPLYFLKVNFPSTFSELDI